MSLMSFYQLLAHSQNISSYDEDIFIAAKQVSQYVLGTRYLDVSDRYIYMDYDQQEMTFELDDHRLVKTPGFEILLTDVDSLSFENNNQYIYMNIERNEKEYRFLINLAKEYRDASQDEEETIES